jgi:hypothetical protein
MKPNMDSGVVLPASPEEDQSVTGAIAGYGECVFWPSPPVMHKPGLVQDIIAGSLQALAI